MLDLTQKVLLQDAAQCRLVIRVEPAAQQQLVGEQLRLADFKLLLNVPRRLQILVERQRLILIADGPPPPPGGVWLAVIESDMGLVLLRSISN